MKLLALRLCEHDSSFCFYDGHQLRYVKTERIKNTKHHAYNNLSTWKSDFEQLFCENVENIDGVVIVLDPWRYGMSTDEDAYFLTQEISCLDLPCKTWRLNHHYAHALSTWMLTDTKPDVSVVMDGFGDYDQAWSIIKNDKIIDRGLLSKHGSLGIEMAQLGKSVGIKTQHDIDIAGKLMGLQSYGNFSQQFYDSLNKHSIRDIRALFSYENWLAFNGDALLSQLTPLDWIKTLHKKTGSALVNFISEFATPDQYISFTGGIAQNVLWNTQLKSYFPNIIIPPHSADDGLTLGAIEWLRIKNNLPSFQLENFPFIQMDETPAQMPDQDTIEQAAALLAAGKTVGWYQGHGEAGPRALGNRSILMDPRLPDGKNIVNSIKKREEYRPFGSTVLHEFCTEYFDLDADPYMLFVAKVKCSNLKAITHVDGTCRVQTLKNENPAFRKLIEAFHKLTGCPVLLNTSLNLAGKPLAGTVQHAIELFQTTSLDTLVVGRDIFKKN